MPITKSAKKALRQNLRRKARNIQKREKLKKILKKIKQLVEGKKIKEARSLLPQFFKFLDKAVKVGLIKENTAARKKSKISKLVTKSRQ